MTRRSKFGRCRWCRSRVWWLTHATTGRMAPVDPTPRLDGNLVVARDEEGVLLGGYRPVLAGSPAPAGERHVMHHAVCPARRRREAAMAGRCRDPVCRQPLPAEVLEAGRRVHDECDPRWDR